MAGVGSRRVGRRGFGFRMLKRALVVRIGFWGILCGIYDKEPLK